MSYKMEGVNAIIFLREMDLRKTRFRAQDHLLQCDINVLVSLPVQV